MAHENIRSNGSQAATHGGPTCLYKQAVIMHKIAGGKYKFRECHNLIHGETSSLTQRAVIARTKLSEHLKGLGNGDIGEKRNYIGTGEITRSEGLLIQLAHQVRRIFDQGVSLAHEGQHNVR